VPLQERGDFRLEKTRGESFYGVDALETGGGRSAFFICHLFWRELGSGNGLYEKFNPEIPPGKKGWGASGKLDLDLIRKMASA
jgi:hypothetical protein